MGDVTRDAFFDGLLVVHQPGRGYRFSIDAVMLAAAVSPQPGDSILDLGTGCGIISLILALRHPTVRISAIEIQTGLAACAAENVAENHLNDRVSVIHADMRSLPNERVQGPFDWVVSNPPFRKPNSGRINPNNQRALARHEIEVNMEQLLACTMRLLRTGGRFSTIYPAERMTDAFEKMRVTGIEPKCIQAVHSQRGQDAKLVLVHCIKGSRPGLRIAAPLLVYDENGKYSEAVQAMMRP